MVSQNDFTPALGLHWLPSDPWASVSILTCGSVAPVSRSSWAVGPGRPRGHVPRPQLFRPGTQGDRDALEAAN